VALPFEHAGIKGWKHRKTVHLAFYLDNRTEDVLIKCYLPCPL
jgi:hypothetical protein